MSIDKKRRCVYDLTDLEDQHFENLMELLGVTYRINIIRALIVPGPVQDAFIQAWRENKKA